MLNTPINVLTLSPKKGEWVAIRQCIFGGGGPQSALLSLLELEPFFFNYLYLSYLPFSLFVGQKSYHGKK